MMYVNRTVKYRAL